MVRINKTRFYAAVGITTLGSFILAGCAQPEEKPAGTAPATSSTAPAATTDKTATGTADKLLDGHRGILHSLCQTIR